MSCVSSILSPVQSASTVNLFKRTSDGKIVISYHSICNFQGAVKRLFYQPVEIKIIFDLKSLGKQVGAGFLKKKIYQ